MEFRVLLITMNLRFILLLGLMLNTSLALRCWYGSSLTDHPLSGVECVNGSCGISSKYGLQTFLCVKWSLGICNTTETFCCERDMCNADLEIWKQETPPVVPISSANHMEVNLRYLVLIGVIWIIWIQMVEETWTKLIVFNPSAKMFATKCNAKNFQLILDKPMVSLNYQNNVKDVHFLKGYIQSERAFFLMN